MELKRKCGILLHPTSFPSNYGIGDFGKEALDFIDFLKKSGQKLWQVLPLGPTSYGDSPYQSFSAFAGNPLLISPDLLVEDGLLKEEELIPARQENTGAVDYGRTIPLKNNLLEKAFLNFTPSGEFKKFCKNNAFWLEDYALFCALKEYFITARQDESDSPQLTEFSKKWSDYLSEDLIKDYYYGGVWITWPTAFAARKKNALQKAKKDFSQRLEFFKFQQFLFFKQWQSLKDYAGEKGIEIIGDLPIFVSFDSADVWANPELFHLGPDGFPTVVAGVPPDYFSETGQLWGNPLYNWAEHEKSGYQWWLNRITHQLRLCDWIRIDHFRGFESCYAIPFGSIDATKGTWVPSGGRNFFRALKKELGTLPIIAEDLGIITKKVEALRTGFGLPGMKVLQFAFGDNAENLYLPHNYEQNTVVYTGTHDNDTAIGWYESAGEKEKDLFRRYLNTDGTAPGWDLIRLAVASTANYALYPLQDVLCLGGESRMNTPGVSGGNWQWRYHEEMLLAGHSENLQKLAELFGR